MKGTMAIIQGAGFDSSVGFSVEEVIAHHHGEPWSEMSEAGLSPSR